MGQIHNVPVFVGIRSHDQLILHDLLGELCALCGNGGVTVHDKDVLRVFVHDELKGRLVPMGGGVNVGIHAHILKSDLHADDGAAAIVAQDVKAAAGTQAHNCILALGKCFQRLNAAVKSPHQRCHLILQTKHGSNRGGIFTDRFHHANAAVGSQIDHRGDLAEGVIGLAQAAADENHVRLTGHDSFQVGLLDCPQVGDGLIRHIALEVIQTGRSGADYTIPHAQRVQNIQTCHIQNGDTLGVIGNLQFRRLPISVQTGNGDGFRSGGS